MNATSKFTLRNLAGLPLAYFLVQAEDLSGQATMVVSQVSHHILVIDRSGSMYDDMNAVKATVEKVLTLSEYRDSGMLVTLITYSSMNDMTVHFERVPVEDVMAPGSRYVDAIRQIRVTGLTCVSQGLQKAMDFVRDNEVTCVSLHSDGYANDRSPSSEKRALDAIVGQVRKKAGVFVNTIAYREWCDFTLLSYIANACSGVCLQTRTAKEVFDALHRTNDLLAGKMAPAVNVKKGDADYVIFYSENEAKIMGSADDILVRGLSPNANRTVYRYKQVSEADYDKASLPVCGEGATLKPVYAYAKTQLAEGNVNRAKFALVATRDPLLDTHYRALVSSEIAALSADLDGRLFHKNLGTPHPTYGLQTANQKSVLEVLDALANCVGDIHVDLKGMGGVYKKRGLRRVAGVRKEDGTLEVPWLRTDFKDDAQFARIGSFDFNRKNATVNMLVTRPIRLVQVSTGVAIDEVMGVKLDNLASFNNYTIVGDGQINIPWLDIRISNKRDFRALAQAHILDDDGLNPLTESEFSPESTCRVTFEGRPVVSLAGSFAAGSFSGLFENIARLKVLSSILTAVLKEGPSDTYTAEQVEMLKRHYLSTSLYVNFPTTNEYTDLQEAMATGKVDSRLSYTVDLGSTSILGVGDLHSANKFLDRMFTIEGEKKPTLMMWWNNPKFGHKTLSARTQVGPVDDLMKPIFEDFLRLDNTGSVAGILAMVGMNAGEITRLYSVLDHDIIGDEAAEILTDTKKAVERSLEGIYRSRVCPLVMYVGSTGLLPDDIDTKAMTAEQVSQNWPLLKIGKGEQDSTFFQVGPDTLLTVSVENNHFTVEA